MRFIREIPADKIVNSEISVYEQNNFTLVWKEDSVEIWADMEKLPETTNTWLRKVA